MPMTARDYTWLFTPGSEFREDETGTVGVIHLVDGGQLWLPTGQVVACDPFVGLGQGEAEPFTVAVDPGHYRVEAAVATLTQPDQLPSDDPHLRVAAARLVIRDEPTAAWELALQPGQDLAELTEDEFYGYGVDSRHGRVLRRVGRRLLPGVRGGRGPAVGRLRAEQVGPGTPPDHRPRHRAQPDRLHLRLGRRRLPHLDRPYGGR